MAMHASFDPAVEEFRAEVREYLRAATAPERTVGHADPRDLTGLDEGFERALQHDAGERGYLALTLPAEHGGGNRSTAYRAATVATISYRLPASTSSPPMTDHVRSRAVGDRTSTPRERASRTQLQRKSRP